MKKINLLLKFSLIAVLVSVFAACSGSNVDEIEPQNAISSFMGANDKIVAFGSANLNEILTKADYKSVPKLGLILSGEIDEFENMIDLNSPIFYAVEGPMDRDGVPAATYGFLKVKSADSLVAKLIQMGYDIDEEAEIRTGHDEGFAIGIRGSLAIIVAKEGEFDGKKMLEKAFELTEGEAAGGKIDEILASKADIVMGVNVESLYGTSETDLSKLSEEKQKEIKDMVANSFVQTTFKFEDGAAIIETKNLFSEKLMSQMFMKTDDNALLIAKLGKGNPRFGFTMNIDVKKLQIFMKEFSPEAEDELARSLGGPFQLALIAAGNDGFSALIDGKFGVVMLGDENGSISEPNFNLFLGLAKKGYDLGKQAEEFLSYGESVVKLEKNGLSMYTNASYAPPGKLNLPKGCENFGKGGFSAFLNLDGLDFDELDLEGEENVIRVVKYVTVEYNNDGGRIYIKARDGKENVLEQAVKEIVGELADEISGISI